MEERDCLIALSLLTEPGDHTVATALAETTPGDVLEQLLSGGHDSSTSVVARERLGRRRPVDLVEEAVTDAAAGDARMVTRADAEWPNRLDDLSELFDESDTFTGTPLCLWIRGVADLRRLTEQSVALIGARACSSYGAHAATELSHGLADRGWTVISGGAFGIDAAAHRGALNGGGSTVCVLAGGIDHVYPAEHAELFERISHTGALVSEWPPGQTPRRYRFLVRNRVIAALGLGTVVVEAGLRSGSRQTARVAAELDRTVMIVPGPITSRSSVGVHQLARGPAPVRVVTRAGEIVEDLSPIGELCEPPPGSTTRPTDRLNPEAGRVLDSVPIRSASTAARIAAQAGVPMVDADRILARLVSAGFVEVDDGRFQLSRHRPRADQPSPDPGGP